jgi:hypothetical protein
MIRFWTLDPSTTLRTSFGFWIDGINRAAVVAEKLSLPPLCVLGGNPDGVLADELVPESVNRENVLRMTGI